MSTASRTALITGASRGIGTVYADRLASRGYDLVLVARNESSLQAIADGLRQQHGVAVAVLPADLAQGADVARVEARLREDAAITMLVNNAGVAAITPLLDTDVLKAQEMIAVNVAALTRLTYAAMPAFAARGAGTLINIASVVGIAPERLNGVYGATKAYVLALSHSLQREFAGTGVRIQAVLPAATATDLWKDAGLPWQKLPDATVMSVEDMVDAALAGLDAGEPVTIPSLHDAEEWQRYESMRRTLSDHFGNARPAPRYRVPAATGNSAE